MEDDNSVVSLLTTLSLPRNSNSISLNVGNTMKTQAKDLGKIIPEKMDLAHASQLQGISDSVSSFTKMYLKEVLNEKPETTYFGMKHIDNVLKLPKTEEEKTLAVEAVKTSLKSIEKSTGIIQKMVGNLKLKKGPQTEPEEKKEIQKTIDMEIEEAKRLLMQYKNENIQSDTNEILGPYPTTVSEAISMFLYSTPITYGLTGRLENKYEISDMLSRSFTEYDPPKQKALKFGDSFKTPPPDFHVFNIALSKDIKSDIAEKIGFFPEITVNLKRKIIKIGIPVLYSNEIENMVGLDRESIRLLGVVILLKLTYLKPFATANSTIYLYISREYSQDYAISPELADRFPLQKDKNMQISLQKNPTKPPTEITFGDGFNKKEVDDIPKKLKKKIYGSRNSRPIWKKIQAHVTRVYLTDLCAMKTYGDIQTYVLSEIYEDRGSVSIGEGSDLKARSLLETVANTGKCAIPIGFVTNFNVEVIKTRKKNFV